MNSFRIGILFAAVLACNSLALAEEAQSRLPKDGWWVRYYVMMKTNQPNDTWTVKRTYSLVGSVIENGQKCRWIEMKSMQSIDGREQTDIIKFLIPEKDLLESDKPLDSLVRAWQKLDDGTVEEVQLDQPIDGDGGVISADFAWGRNMAIFPGPQRKAIAHEERKVVEYQKGRLEIAGGRNGTHVATRNLPTSGEKHAFNTSFTVWNHPSVLPACAAMRQRIEYRRNDVLLLTTVKEIVVEDFGTAAKSALPDNN